MRACALNHLDLFIRNGIPGLKIPMPHALGSDIAGEVVEAGELCGRIAAGRRVLLSPGVSCRQCPQCLAGRDNFCRQYTLFGLGIDGGDAEYLAAPEYTAIPIPDDMTFEEAAAAPLVFLTAWHMLFWPRSSRGRRGCPGAGGVERRRFGGYPAAPELFHCRVIATAGGEEKLAKARELGADEVIDHYRQDIAGEVKKLTGKRGVDVVFENVGAATWPKSLECLAAGGRLVTCGATTGYNVKLDLRFLFNRQHSILGSFMGSMGELHEVLKFVFRRKVRPIIDQTFPLSEIRAAHKRLDRKEQFGKIVLIP